MKEDEIFLCIIDNLDPIPTLSVVMPVHNPNRYLSLCLDSILQQTFDDFELIAIDDASSDDSYAILSAYAADDARLKVMHNEQSLGAAGTRNRGLYEARGQYILFLDADDFFEKDYFEDMVTAISSAGADIVLCPILFRDERDGTEKVIPKDLSRLADLCGKTFSPRDFQSKIFYGMPFAPFNKMIRREMLIEKKIEFQSLPNSNDVYFGLITIAESKRIVYLSKPYVHYRYNTGFQISTNRHKNPMCVCNAFKKVREDFIARGLWNKYCQMYHDIAVCTISAVVRSTFKPEELLEYLQGDSVSALGLSNLHRKDFSDLLYYGWWDVLIHGKRAILGNILDVIYYSIKAILRGEIFALCGLMKLCFIVMARKCKK